MIREITTTSMLPTLRPGDRVRFTRSGRAPKPGEIWAFAASDGRHHIAHRVLWRRRDGRVLTKGDWLLLPDGWIAPDRFFGPAVERSRAGAWRSLLRKRDRARGLVITALGSACVALEKLLTRRAAR
ncbi:MAG: S24/S26 family peptidase [Myxococcales bacterium]|jgi:hypothetical protein|nr:S24/S26 family peptidase [Myxococcales bacterium]